MLLIRLDPLINNFWNIKKKRFNSLNKKITINIDENEKSSESTEYFSDLNKSAYFK